MTERVLLISSDCHIDFPAARAKEYLATAHHDLYDRWLGALFAAMPAALAGLMDPDAAKEGSFTMAFASSSDPEGRAAFTAPADNEVRLKALEAQGVAAEIVIPNPQMIPFWSPPGSRGKPGFDLTMQNVGFQAYNRWLAETLDPVRQGGLAMVGYEDVDRAVSEIRWAASVGMRGVFLEGQVGDLPPLFESYYEPIWDALEEEGLVATFHAGAGFHPEYDALASPVAMQVMFTESTFFAHRPLWMLIYGGVLERHPGLKIAFTEQFSDWVPGALDYLDREWSGRSSVVRGLHEFCPRLPREYWERQCYVGASIMSRAEVALRYEIGVDNIMYGTDFAHPEGTWGKTLEHLQGLFGAAAVPEDEVRRILGGNAARVYRFDLDALAPVAERCGYTIDEVMTPPAAEAHPEVEITIGRPTKGW